ncbi:uncharacterized protein V2V93DRAFT_366864 [Kockiozyma suomiensis]|uniref:uncharacterized protein n=1 Tax=Kockiozyma suomiensis TaxID=1337062 RepID=UPI0033431EFF
MSTLPSQPLSSTADRISSESRSNLLDIASQTSAYLKTAGQLANSRQADEDIIMEDPVPSKFGHLYLDLFMLALSTVLELESHLFDDSEIRIFDQFKALSEDSKKLYVRLFMRRRNRWIRTSTLGSYREIENIAEAYGDLISSKIFCDGLNSNIPVDIDEILMLFGIDELKQLAKQFNFTGFRGTKKDMIDKLKTQSDRQTCLDWSHNGLSLLYDKNGRKQHRSLKLLRKSLELLGPCIRLCTMTAAVFDRVHLVFYRADAYNESSLSKLILAKISKRNFPKYSVLRSSDVFRGRAELLQYEEALRIQDVVDQAFDNGLTAQLSAVYEILEPIYSAWNKAIKKEREINVDRDHYLKRFSAVYIYTRLVYKFALVLSRLGKHLEAHEVYTALLAQTDYRQGKRGDWYQRKALIENRYFGGPEKDDKERKFWKRQALLTCENGLQDQKTHLIYHYDLQKRIVRLEKELKVLPRDRHIFDHVALKEPVKRTFYGRRISNTVIGKKGVWVDDRENECSVEEMCLSNYRKLGWQGYHTEGGLLKTIFAYLFYDIIFLPVPFVFETEFQNAPLDLATDAFYFSRASEINHRLADIQNGYTRDIIMETYEREHERQTECVGLDWRFDIREILEAAECIGNSPLSVLCRVFSEEYQYRGSGLPDLFLWNYEQKKSLFSEVKSENDRLSDTQRLWIDVLINAGVDVELCAAIDQSGHLETEI